MPLDHLFVCRHGEYTYDIDAGLTDIGQQQAVTLGTEISSRLEGVERTVLCSLARRAKETAKIIADILGADVEETEALWCESGRKGDLRKNLELMDACTKPVLVIVTHKEFTGSLPRLYAQRAWGTKFFCPDLEYGQAWYTNPQSVKPERITS